MWFGGALLMLALAPLALRLVPLPAALLAPAPASPEILDREGRTLREITCDEARFAHPLAFDGLPTSIVQATIAAEDKRFWRHGGVDWIGTARAACDLVRRGRVISGGSTITQQLIKLAEPRPRTFQTKLIEAVTAMRLEQEWDKRRILAEYLNRLDYGNGRSGCASAAQVYFGKTGERPERGGGGAAGFAAKRSVTAESLPPPQPGARPTAAGAWQDERTRFHFRGGMQACAGRAAAAGAAQAHIPGAAFCGSTVARVAEGRRPARRRAH